MQLVALTYCRTTNSLQTSLYKANYKKSVSKSYSHRILLSINVMRKPCICLSLTDTSMEVSRRRVLQKHLEPARPLRRCLHGVIGKQSDHIGLINGNGSKVLVWHSLCSYLTTCSYETCITSFRAQRECCYMCTGSDGGGASRGKKSLWKLVQGYNYFIIDQGGAEA